MSNNEKSLSLEELNKVSKAKGNIFWLYLRLMNRCEDWAKFKNKIQRADAAAKKLREKIFNEQKKSDDFAADVTATMLNMLFGGIGNAEKFKKVISSELWEDVFQAGMQGVCQISSKAIYSTSSAVTADPLGSGLDNQIRDHRKELRNYVSRLSDKLNNASSMELADFDPKIQRRFYERFVNQLKFSAGVPDIDEKTLIKEFDEMFWAKWILKYLVKPVTGQHPSCFQHAFQARTWQHKTIFNHNHYTDAGSAIESHFDKSGISRAAKISGGRIGFVSSDADMAKLADWAKRRLTQRCHFKISILKHFRIPVAWRLALAAKLTHTREVRSVHRSFSDICARGY